LVVIHIQTLVYKDIRSLFPETTVAAEPQMYSLRRDVTAANAPRDSVDNEHRRQRVSDISSRHRAPSAPETYTSTEYRTWSRDRPGRSPSAGARRRKSADTAISRNQVLTGEVPAGVSAVSSCSSSAGRRLRSTADTPQGSLTRASGPQARQSAYRRLNVSSGGRGPPETVRLTSSDGRERIRAASEASSAANATSAKTPLTRQPLKIRSEEFRSYRSTSAARSHQRKPNVEDVGGLDGILSVHVYCGYGLRIAPTILRDLYCVIGVDSVNRARTAVQSGAVNFDWDELFDVDVVGARTVTFNVYNWSRGTKQKLYFTGTVDLSDYVIATAAAAAGDGGVRQPQRLALRLEPTGVLYIELVHGDLSHAYRRSPAPSAVASVAVFGVDLDDLVARERAGGLMPADGGRGQHVDVPAVVRRCVDEVERRGLEAVGVYRLCCGARRKRQLKAELEADVAGVNLSSDRVPDINVVTCESHLPVV
jgi:hypothetical protein